MVRSRRGRFAAPRPPPRFEGEASPGRRPGQPSMDWSERRTGLGSPAWPRSGPITFTAGCSRYCCGSSSCFMPRTAASFPRRRTRMRVVYAIRATAYAACRRSSSPMPHVIRTRWKSAAARGRAFPAESPAGSMSRCSKRQARLDADPKAMRRRRETVEHSFVF